MRSNRGMKTITSITALAAIVLLANVVTLSQRSEHITATAMGTATQTGRVIPIELLINSYSTEAERIFWSLHSCRMATTA